MLLCLVHRSNAQSPALALKIMLGCGVQGSDSTASPAGAPFVCELSHFLPRCAPQPQQVVISCCHPTLLKAYPPHLANSCIHARTHAGGNVMVTGSNARKGGVGAVQACKACAHKCSNPHNHTHRFMPLSKASSHYHAGCLQLCICNLQLNLSTSLVPLTSLTPILNNRKRPYLWQM